MTKQQTYFPNLDGLRSVAFLWVFVYHIFGYLNYSSSGTIETSLIRNVFLNGHHGVNLFFVLSGYLISYLLIFEKENKGKIAIGNFYMRRILRIWPLFYLVLVLGFIIYPLLIGKFDMSHIKQHLGYYLGFLNNIDRMNTGFVGVGNDGLGVLWSIAVEEQFYLFWPFVIQFLNKKQMPVVFMLIIIFSLIFRYFNVHDPNVLYFHTFSVMSDLAMGGLCAYLVLNSPGFLRRITDIPKVYIISIYFLGTSAALLINYWVNWNDLTRTFERVILATFFSFIILEQCFALNSFYKFKDLVWLSKMGVITYGLYCFHLFMISFIQYINHRVGWLILNKFQFYSELAMCLLLSVIVCYISYNYFEKKILLFKEKYI